MLLASSRYNSIASIIIKLVFVFILINVSFSQNAIAKTESDNDKSAKTQLDATPLRIAVPSLEALDENTFKEFHQLVLFIKDFWRIWAIDNNTVITFIPIKTSETLSALNNNEVDVISLALTPTLKTNFLFSLPYAKYKQRIYRKLDGDETNGIQIGIHSSNKNTLAFLGTHIERTYFDSIDDLLNQYENFDALYSVSPWDLNVKLKEKNILNEYYISTEEAPELFFHFSTRKSDRSLMYSINESLRAVNTVQAERWSKKYLPINSGSISLVLGHYFNDLSEEEKQYTIDVNQLEYLLIEDGFPPYIITQSFTNISERGFAIDLAKLVTERTGLIFKPRYFTDISEAITSLSTGETSLTLLSEHSNLVSNNFDFTTPYLKSHYSIITRKDSPISNSIRFLTKEKVAVVKLMNSTRLLQELLPEADIRKFSSVKGALNAVAKGEVNAFVGHSLWSAYTIKHDRLLNLISQPLPNFNQGASLSFATAKNQPYLLSLLNRTLNSVSADEFDDLYAKWSKTAFNEKNVQAQVKDAYRNAGYVLAIFLFVSCTIAWVYIRQLNIRKVAQRKVEHALSLAEKAKLEAENSAQAKTTFLARMSHEIRTPMNGVFGMAEALSYTKLDKKQQALLDTLQGSATNLLALLNDVLDFSKMDAGKLTLETVPVDLHELAQNTLANFKHHEKEKPIQLTLDIDDIKGQYYLTDPTRLTQVLNNLISNSVKFTDKGLIDLSIKLIDRHKANTIAYDIVEISVKDTGIGINKDNQSLLFTPFIQADDDISRKFGGTGLGLSICQEIVTAMGGKITIESSEGFGSLFHFTLTLKQVHNVKKNQERRKNIRTIGDPEDNRFKGIRVLVAEDNMVNVQVLSAQLARLHITPDIAKNGLQALEMHNENPYDIIISDCHMPVMDGFELAKKLTSINNANVFWLIAITADALSGSAEKCLAAGFDDYMAKPCPQNEVTNKLNHALRQFKIRQESNENQLNKANKFSLFSPQTLLKENEHDLVISSRIAAVFVDSWQIDKDVLQTAINTLDYKKVHATTHKCKGSVRYLCGSKLDELMLNIEKYATSEDRKSVVKYVTELTQKLDFLILEIKDWLASVSESAPQ